MDTDSEDTGGKSNPTKQQDWEFLMFLGTTLENYVRRVRISAIILATDTYLDQQQCKNRHATDAYTLVKSLA